MNQRGSTAALTALVMVMLIGCAGLAVDTARAWLVEDRLKTAIDAASLVAARQMSDLNRDAQATAVFWAQFTQGGGSHKYLGATVTNLLITPDANDSSKIQVSATATVPTTLFGVISAQTVAFSDFSVAQRAGTGLEVALVLDNTGSMAGNNAYLALQTAATQLIDILYGSADTQPNLWVSVVPFAAEVNIGKTHTDWLVGKNVIQTPYSPTSWMGCVMARTANTGAANGDDSNDETPAQAPLKPFLYLSTWHMYSYTTKSQGKTVTNYYTGDNDWQPSTWTKKGTGGITNEPDGGDSAVGPNLGCPALPIMPETASKNTILTTTINNMVPVYRGGTFINLGLQAGWWTISPNWQGLWGTPPDPKLGALPLAYNTSYMKKAIVLMTDGLNNWNDWTGGVPGQGPSPWVNDHDADFTAYGRLLTNVANLPTNNPTTTLNTLMTNMCTTIKSNNVIIYTILFNSGTAPTQATIDLFTACASPNNYTYAPNQAALQAAFQQVGSQLASLRLAQ
jgi:Flp pilus assembly protein TadG